MFVFDGLADWEPGYAVAGINQPRFQLDPGRYRIQTVAPAPGPVQTMGGIRIEPDLTLDRLSPGNSAMLILPGGFSWEMGQNTEAVELAGSFLDAGIPVAAICGATFSLALGGLLDRRRHTSNDRSYLAATQYRGESFYEEAPAVTDGDLITAAGIASIDFACHIFRRLDLYSPAVLEAWYALYKTGNPEYFYALMEAAAAPKENENVGS